MKFQLKLQHKNTFPVGAVLIRNPSVVFWIQEMQRMQLSLQQVQVYALPGLTANSIWGCLLVPSVSLNKDTIGKNEFCQRVSENFFIAERSVMHPSVTAAEIEKIFASGPHVMHPEFGLAELSSPLSFQELLEMPEEKSYYVHKPLPGVFVPKQVKSFQVQPVPPEEVLKKMEENIFPKKKDMTDKPLNFFEKGKLGFYKMLFGGGKEQNSGSDSSGTGVNSSTEKKGWMQKLGSLFGSNKESKLLNKMQQDFEELERRNQENIKKLLDLLKKDPFEALKYAIPLDENSSSRGTNNGQLDLSMRWFNFSWMSSSGGGGGSGGAIDIGDHYYTLQKQYNETAEELIKQKEYQKAAFVYMKLLKNHFKAAETLELGKFYQEAASIYLKHCNNKNKAADCYEKGNMTLDAIEIYKELKQNEKVGDLYTGIRKKKEADIYFEKVVDEYKQTNQYVKASLIYRNKIHDAGRGQALLFEGWKDNKDAVNCLNLYFSNIPDINQLNQEINSIYANDLNEQNRESFLRVIKHEYDKKNELADSIKEKAYEIVAAQIAINPAIVSELRGFNENNKELTKDTIRFTLNKRR